jgi:Ca2+-binding EF-hand superfamily protein
MSDCDEEMEKLKTVFFY